MTDQKKKKILFLITKSNWGGAQKYVYDLATTFVAQNFDVVVALGGEGELKKKLKEKNIKTISIKRLSRDVSILDEIKVFFDLIKIFKEEEPSVVHLNSSKIGGLGSLAGRIAKVPKIVFTAHGWAFNEDRDLFQKNVIKFLSWLTVILSHRTITIAKREKKQMVDYPFVSKKIFTIYNAVSPVEFLRRDEARKELLGDKGEGYKWIGTIAELHKNKGLKYAIKTMKYISKDDSNVIFVVIGEGELKYKLERKIKEKNLLDRVFLVGKKEEAMRLLKAFDIFLLPSIKEGLPYVLFEAGLAELPVVATNVGGVSEIIENMETGIIVRPKNPKEIHLAISYLITNKEKSDSFGKNLNKKIKEKFNFNKMIEKTEKLYFS